MKSSSNQRQMLKHDLRAKIILTLNQIQEGESLSSVLEQQLMSVNERDRGLFHELTLGTLRQWYALKTIALPLIKHPIDNNVFHAGLYLGLYQLIYTRIPAHAAISETVQAIKQLNLDHFSPVINAILREYTRNEDSFKQTVQDAHGLPSWLYKRLKNNWPEHIQDICQNLRLAAPITLRVNHSAISRNEYLAFLAKENIDATTGMLSDQAIHLSTPYPITKLPGFNEGLFSVQDEHAQLCQTLQPQLDDKLVIDACAAPGGKTTHILEHYSPKKIIALDQSEQRLLRVQSNLERLQLDHKNIEIICADATTWQSYEPVDCIILDAPCSATGVIRRHPDIRLLRKPSDIEDVVQLQHNILNHMWQQLKEGGYLVYVTCSILKIENEQQMQTFFSSHDNAIEQKIAATWGIEQQYGRQLLPTQSGGDGFFYCVIQKVSN
ncbi:16S rRNA (cytosine(967)-C(5))-methyltransferase RsmB [Acinetobacter apis]|uniref:16S rRNA (cytosine(967)-C(5))-methyltransferase n=1 Tax=Acinetobacter apis TaxID=1229165 RepID=A0A217EHZ7_9GAMM|nr:16S rRNA (cytosine(967)-C(5))-methyltransferase RsmB [Acinetobacter apis]SNQ30121.1 16S rRNA (cytosine967-C5)-methyltransferase [Acinetobacter apis]